MPSVIIFSVCHAECQNLVHYAECHYAECRSAIELPKEPCKYSKLTVILTQLQLTLKFANENEP
jgi:hypothetical protein